jgi:hypothetical protein
MKMSGSQRNRSRFLKLGNAKKHAADGNLLGFQLRGQGEFSQLENHSARSRKKPWMTKSRNFYENQSSHFMYMLFLGFRRPPSHIHASYGTGGSFP